MKYLNHILFFSAVVFSIVSCKKSELKNPTEILFAVGINAEPAINGNLNFTDGQIILRSLTFDGIRIKGDDVYFEKEFEGGLNTSLSNTNTNSQLIFQIPQGSYTSIRIDFESEQSGSEKISINGSYKKSNGDIYPITVEVERIEFYDKIVKNAQGDTNIDLIAGNSKTAIIQLNPAFWFSNISSNQLDNANLTTIGGVTKILINPETNEDLYDSIEDKINSNIEITID
jgi:hypothetical protein